MNVNQQMAFNARKAVAAERGHSMSYVDSPIERKAFCSCGWKERVSRRQNARGAVQRLRAKVNEHFREAVK